VRAVGCSDRRWRCTRHGVDDMQIGASVTRAAVPRG
jgi:hypothetical protein